MLVRLLRSIPAGGLALVLSIAAGIQFPVVTLASPQFPVVTLASPPALPRTYVDTTYVRPTGTTRHVSAGGDFQAALNAARPGDVILLQAGATFTGNFTLPKKPSSKKWIYVQGTAYGDLPSPGTRVAVPDASLMPKIVSPNGSPTISTAPGAHHFRFVGIEVTVAPDVHTTYSILAFGGAEAKAAQLPSDLIVDRCYVHGQATGDVFRTILLNSKKSAVIDSYVSEAHVVGFDSQAILGYNGPGPFKIVNNYLEGAGENIMFGGVDSAIQKLVPSDIEIRRNTLSKKLSWKLGDPSYAGTPWAVKNLLELKNAQRVLIDGNVMEHNWVHTQSGFAVLFTPRNQTWTAWWTVVQDVTFTNNIIRDSWAGFSIFGFDWPAYSQQTKRILIANNLLEGLGRGAFLQISANVESITVDHNAAFSGYAILIASGTVNSRAADVAAVDFVFTNNIMGFGDYGIIGDNVGFGTVALTRYFPNAVFDKNLLVGPTAVAQLPNYPAGTLAVTSQDLVGFVDWPAGDYRLAPSSPYKNAGTDAEDLAPDFDALTAAQERP